MLSQSAPLSALENVGENFEVVLAPLAAQLDKWAYSPLRRVAGKTRWGG